MLPFRARVDLWAIAIKGYFAFPKAPALLKPHHQIVQGHIPGHSLLVVTPVCRDAVGIFFSPSRLSYRIFECIRSREFILLAGCDTGSIFKRSINAEVSFSLTGCLIKPKESRLPYYLPMGQRRTDSFIPFRKVFAQNRMQIAVYIVNLSKDMINHTMGHNSWGKILYHSQDMAVCETYIECP